MALLIICVVFYSIWTGKLCTGTIDLLTDQTSITESDDSAVDKCSKDEEIFLNDTTSVRYLTSPGYPNMSYPNVECLWTIGAPTGFLFRIFLEHFVLNDPTLDVFTDIFKARGHEDRCTFGYVEIGLGLRESKFKNDSHYVRVRICSDLKTNKTFQSVTNRIYVRYVSKPYLTVIDRWDEIRGFRLEYSLFKDTRYSSKLDEQRRKSVNFTELDRRNILNGGGGGVPSVVIVFLLFIFGVIPTLSCLFYVWRSKKRSQFTLHAGDNSKVVPRIVVQRKRGSSASSIVDNSGGPFLNVTLDLNDMSLHSFSIHSDNSAVNLRTDPSPQHSEIRLHTDTNR